VIVNLDKIVTCQRKDRRLRIELSDGSHVIASRSGSQDLRKLFL
jgi:DNA-binding LytR/AlgR family response regulator